MNKQGKFAVGAIIAAGAGYVTGLLTAPKSGRETRKDIRAAALKAKADAEKQLKHVHSELNNLLDEAAIIAKKSKGKIGAEAEALMTQAKNVRQKTRELLSAIHEGEAEDNDLQKAINEVKQASDHLKKYIAKNNS
ncbi:MAG TPA: YtxH domain-containing protein [Gammaproteobacteria bacterium]|nr:YtxH domain-containing protein [Gammaproteobacteria bacterium]